MIDENKESKLQHGNNLDMEDMIGTFKVIVNNQLSKLLQKEA